MKNALILHATSNDSSGNWYSWLRDELEQKGYQVWLPNLPHSDVPNIQRYNKFILGNKDYKFNEKTLIVGHSSGAVAALGLLEELPENVAINKCVLISVFENGLGWDSLKELFTKQLDFKKIKTKAKKFTVIHSDNDPHCPLDGAERVAKHLGAEFIVKTGQGHFNLEVGNEYKKFPFLLEAIAD